MEETEWIQNVTLERLSAILHELDCDNFSPFLSEGFLKAWSVSYTHLTLPTNREV